MALQIWLPLCKDGDYKNLGILGDLTVSTTPTFVNSGKIGSKSMSSGSMYMTAEQTNKVLNNDSFSIAFWIYVNLNAGTSKGTTLFGNANMSPPNNRRFTLYHYNTCNRLHVSWCNYDSSTDIISYMSEADLCPSYTWTHIALTYSKSSGKVLLYKNGTLYATVKTGIFLNNPTYAFQTTLMADDSTRYLQDYRVYSNCLTPQEVKEISKGLVAHYTLGSASVYEATTNYGRMSDTVLLKSSCANDWSLEKLDRDTLKITALKDNPSYDTWGDITESVGGTKSIAANVACTLSCEIVDYKGSLARIYPASGGFGSIVSQTFSNRVYRTITHTAAWTQNILIRVSDAVNIRNGDYLIIRNTQIEEKDHPTLYTSTSRSTGLVYDSSGFGRNLIITGNILPSDSVRYDRAVYLPNQNANANYLSANGWSPQNFLTTGSISFWCKFNGLGSAGWLPFIGLSGSYYVMAWNNGGDFYHENSGSGTKTIYRDGAVVTAPSDNGNWHHYVITGIDLSSWTNFKINQYGNSWDSNMYISDIRIYNTVLTLLDAKDLYSLGATIS